MDHKEVGRFWEANADAWTKLSRAGYDVYRDYLNTPAFLDLLPGVEGMSSLDIGCGEGHNTRLVARLGAQMSAIDISQVFIRYAQESEETEALGIQYRVASAVELPYPDASFDFLTAFMSLMDIPETETVISEAFRVLKPGGFLQFSITHPCFDTPYRKNLRDTKGRTYAIEVGEYFNKIYGVVDEWTFSASPLAAKQNLPKFKVPWFTHTISEWINLLIDTGFVIEKISEPQPDDKT